MTKFILVKKFEYRLFIFGNIVMLVMCCIFIGEDISGYLGHQKLYKLTTSRMVSNGRVNNVYMSNDMVGLKGKYQINYLGCETYSMYPTMNCGDYVIEEAIQNISSVNIGDIISYSKDGSRIIHRVIFKGDDYVLVQGDNNKFMDPYKIYSNMSILRAVGVFYNFNRTSLEEGKINESERTD